MELKEKEMNSNSLQQGDESALADFINAARMYAGTRITGMYFLNFVFLLCL